MKILINMLIALTLGCSSWLNSEEIRRAVPIPNDFGSPVARWILVFYGSDPQVSERRRIWPPDTLTAMHLQMPLEWLGYEVEFRSITEPLPKMPLDRRYAGVICDGTLRVPAALEDNFFKWLVQAKEQGVREFFLGDIPILEPALRGRLLKEFGMKDSGVFDRNAKDTFLAYADEVVMHGETPLRPRSHATQALIAPDGARVLLGLGGTNGAGASMRFDAAFIAGWGGALGSSVASSRRWVGRQRTGRPLSVVTRPSPITSWFKSG